MENYGEKSIEAHGKLHGKLETKSKMPVKTMEDLSIAYTPGVGAVSEAIGKDKSLARTHTMKGNSVAIVTDGSAILGLGNLGPEAALPVMEGKAILFKEFADIDAFPICLSTQDTEEIISAVKAIAPTFGGINLEDISAPRCFEIENRLREELSIPVMHDDQHGTAVVVLAGLINALKIRNSQRREVEVVISGAGAAGVAITEILLAHGFQHVVMSDSSGAIYQGREGLPHEKEALAVKTNLACAIDLDDPRCETGDLAQALVGADIFIGVSKGNLLTKEMVRSMADDPIIFAMANPIPEIWPEEALDAGAMIVATGRSDFPNQVNNVLAFPGIFRGALDNHTAQFTQDMFIRAAEALAGIVENPTPEKILPDPFDKNIVEVVAGAMKT